MNDMKNKPFKIVITKTVDTRFFNHIAAGFTVRMVKYNLIRRKAYLIGL